MKKIISVLLIAVLSLGCISIASAEVIMLPDFEITSDGEITEYHGGEWVVVPENIDGIPVNKIGEKVFFDLGISDAYLPDGLSVIGKSAFEGSNITSIDIPKVSIIGERAFANCTELRAVYTSIDENTVIGKDAFAGTSRVLFYLDCDVDTKTVERNILLSNGGVVNFQVEIRHVEPEYDEEGNTMCLACGFKELPETESLPFSDVSESSWYYSYVKSAYYNKIINGKSEGLFDPDATMTCAEAVKIAACIKATNGDEIPAHTEGAWYQPYVDYAYDKGLIAYYMDFDWEKPITRAEMAYIFSHCDPYDEWYKNINTVPLNDVPDVDDSTPYVYEIIKLYNKGIAVGDENMNFYPNSNIKRCEAAAIVARIMDWTMRVELPKG